MRTVSNVLASACLVLITFTLSAQNGVHPESKSIAKNGWYGGLSSKHTTFRNKSVNMVEVFGGWFLNKNLLLGVSASVMNNNPDVPENFKAQPGVDLKYEYCQFGLYNEYVIRSDKKIHFAFTLFNGVGMTDQYIDFQSEDYNQDTKHCTFNEDWFYVAEPGVQAEVNIFKWMKFSPGISYRASFGSHGLGLGTCETSNLSYNATIKLGRF